MDLLSAAFDAIKGFLDRAVALNKKVDSIRLAEANRTEESSRDHYIKEHYKEDLIGDFLLGFGERDIGLL